MLFCRFVAQGYIWHKRKSRQVGGASIVVKEEAVDFMGEIYWDHLGVPTGTVYFVLVGGFQYGLVLVPTKRARGQYERFGRFERPGDAFLYERFHNEFIEQMKTIPPSADKNTIVEEIDDARYPDEHFLISII
jgi:hypothetical protein